MATRTQDQKFDLLVTAIKANEQCKSQRQNFSLIRATPLGRHIQPQIAKESAIQLIDCFHRLQLNPIQAQKRKASIQCLKNGGNCQNQIKIYLQHK